MKTYIFTHKHTSATLTISAETEEEAREEMASILLPSEDWRLDTVEEDEDYFVLTLKSE